MHNKNKTFIFSCILSIILLSSCSSTEQKAKQKKADLFFGHGTEHLIKRNYTQALTFLLKAQELAPERSDIHNNLGMAYYFKGKKRTALKLVKKAVILDGKNTDARANLASIYLEANKLKSARAQYEKVLEDLTYTKQYQTYYNLGVLEQKLDREEKAKNFFKLSIKEKEYSCGALFQLGLMSLKKSDNREAIQYLEKGSDGPCYNSQASNYYLGLAYQRVNDYKKASKQYKMFLRQFPKSKYSVSVKDRLTRLENDRFEDIMYSKEDSDLQKTKE